MAQHRRKDAQYQVMTGNLLAGGEVVYMTKEGKWEKDIHNAMVAQNPQEAEALIKKAKDAQDLQEVVDTYLFEVSLEDEGRRPLSVRESIRQKGPTVPHDFSPPSGNSPHGTEN